MRLPMIWTPARSAGVAPAEVTEPVGHLDLAATFCQVAGIDRPEWIEGRPLPETEAHAAEQGRGAGPDRVGLRAPRRRDAHQVVYQHDGWLCTAYEESTLYDGTEGELYNLVEDPEQRENLWDDASHASIRSDLVALLYDSMPPQTLATARAVRAGLAARRRRPTHRSEGEGVAKRPAAA